MLKFHGFSSVLALALSVRLAHAMVLSNKRVLVIAVTLFATVLNGLTIVDFSVVARFRGKSLLC